MPTVNNLTDAKCRTAPIPAKPKKLFDGYGMFLFLSPTGSKIWRFTYRIDGKAQTSTIGPYPLVSLADARVRRDDLRRKLLDGVDLKAAPKKSMLFGEAVTQYWETRKDITERYRLNATRGLAMHLGVLDAKPMALITRDMLLDPLMTLDAQGKHVYSRRVRVWASMVFEWAKTKDQSIINPATLINPKTTFGHKRVVHHAALKITEVPAFFARLALESELQSVLACHMIALTWVRTGELRKMLWSEIEGDLWRIPEGRMKMGREHLVPLSKQALGLLDKLRARSRGGVYVFPSDRRIDRPMSENSVLYLLHRLGYQGLMTGHGWRTVTSTWANEHGYNPDAIEMALAHASGDAVRGIYNQAAYLPQRRAMLQDWADWLDQANTSRPQS